MGLFCPKCGSILMPQKDGKVGCACGYSEESENIEIREEVRNESVNIDVSEGEEEKTLPIEKIECPKCANMEAYYWLVQMRAADEPETQFYRCTKCKHTWRKYE